jgi:phosphoribosylamine--glycine ligase
VQRYGIKTADFKLFGRASNGVGYVKEEYDQGRGRPLVIKADGLASGKGVIVAKIREGAINAVEIISSYPAGYLFLLEEYLEGWECSFTVLTDGENIVPFPVAKDYKRLSKDEDAPNTGGMGGYIPVPAVTPKLYDEMLEIAKLIVSGLKSEGRPFKGFLYIGFMITKDGLYVLEINCRLGDPEAQVILPLLDSDFVELCYRAAKSDLANAAKPVWSNDALVNVVIASPGYPKNPKIGHKIYGLEEAAKEGALVFHGGTRFERGSFKTNGGRILSIVGRGESIEKARERAYLAASKISFGKKDPSKGFHKYREDIAHG